MKCQDCQELFSLYLDGEIDQISRSEVESHFRSCPQCKEEWQAFKRSVELLQNMPMARVPPDFLTGIHAKLEPLTPWQRAREFFMGQSQRRWAMSTAFAMLFIGFATASLIQVIPVSRTNLDTTSQRPAPADQMAENTMNTSQPSLLVAQNQDDTQQNFYPGVPLLSEYEGEEAPVMQYAMIPRRKAESHIPVVDYVSTGSVHSPSAYLDTPLSSFTTRQQQIPPTIQPDLQITIHAAPRAEQMAIVRQIVQSPLWRAELYNHNTLLLSVPSHSFNQLLQICCTDKTSLSPDYARNSHYISLKRFLTVAVKLD